LLGELQVKVFLISVERERGCIRGGVMNGVVFCALDVSKDMFSEAIMENGGVAVELSEFGHGICEVRT